MAICFLAITSYFLSARLESAHSFPGLAGLMSRDFIYTIKMYPLEMQAELHRSFFSLGKVKRNCRMSYGAGFSHTKFD